MIIKIFLSLISMIALCSCSSGSNIEGRVIDAISNEPIADILVIAKTKTDIKEDKKYEECTARTNGNGTFTLKGLSSKYRYVISTNQKEYSVVTIHEEPPAEGQTKILNNALKIIKYPEISGVFFYKNKIYTPLKSFNSQIVKLNDMDTFPDWAAQGTNCTYLPSIDNDAYNQIQNESYIVAYNIDLRKYKIYELINNKYAKYTRKNWQNHDEVLEVKEGIYFGVANIDSGNKGPMYWILERSERESKELLSLLYSSDNIQVYKISRIAHNKAYAITPFNCCMQKKQTPSGYAYLMKNY